MKRLFTILTLVLFMGGDAFAAEQSVLARVTVYWHSGRSGERACSNGARLRAGHCAVDPNRIPFGSEVIFADAACVAVDSGPDVVSRKAARQCGRTASQRSAVVIDRFFETKSQAMTWMNSHPQFMTVRVISPAERSPKKTETASGAGTNARSTSEVVERWRGTAERDCISMSAAPGSALFRYGRRGS